jgi:hypothetical protein
MQTSPRFINNNGRAPSTPLTPTTPPSATISSSFVWLPASQKTKFSFPVGIFLDQDFNPTTFVTRYRAQVDTLQTLQQECTELYEFLKEHTISLIHSDYNSFIEFSAQLAQLKDQVEQVSQPLPSLNQPLFTFNAYLERVVSQCNTQLSNLENAQLKKKIAQELLLIHSQLKLTQSKPIMSNITEQTTQYECMECAIQIRDARLVLDRLNTNDIARVSASEQHKAHLEKIVSFYNTCDQLWKQIDSTFAYNLQKIFNTLTSACDNKELVRVIIEAFRIIGREESLYSYLTQFWIQPLCDSVFNRNRNLTSANVYRSLEQLLCDKKGKWYFLICIVNEWRVLTRVVLPAIVKELCEPKMRHLYEYRDRTKFHENYCDQQQFIKSMRQLLSDASLETVDLRESDTEFTKAVEPLEPKWQIKFYFSLIRQHIAPLVENILTSSTVLDVSKDDDDGFEFAITKAIYTTIMKECFHSSVFIEALSSEFCELLITILSRLEAFMIHLGTSPDTSQQFSFTLVRLLFDIQVLRSTLQIDLIDRIKNMISIEHIEISESMQKLILHVINTRTQIPSKYASQMIIANITAQCTAPLHKGLSYTITGSSNYVSTMVKHFHAFVKKIYLYQKERQNKLLEIGGFDSNIDLDQNMIKSWLTEIITQVCDTFLAKALEQIRTTQTTRAAVLKTMKGNTANNEVNEITDRMINQIHNDAESFEKSLMNPSNFDPGALNYINSIDMTECDSYQKLRTFTSKDLKNLN